MSTTYSAEQFLDDASGARKATDKEPVFITEQGLPAHVILSIEEYRKLKGEGMSLLEMIADTRPEADFDFEIPQLKNLGFKFVDFD